MTDTKCYDILSTRPHISLQMILRVEGQIYQQRVDNSRRRFRYSDLIPLVVMD